MLFERVLRKDPTRDDVRRRLVDTAIELGRYSDALAHVKVLRQTFPKEGRFDYQAGICHESLGDHEMAAEAFQAAIDDTPELIEPWEHLAWLLHSRPGREAESEQLMLKLVQVNSKDVKSWLARAGFRVRTLQSELASGDIERALKLAPNDPEVLHAAGAVGIARASQAKAEGRIPLAERIAIETETLLARDDLPKLDQRKLDVQRIILEAEFGSLKRAFTLASRLLEEPSSPDRMAVHQLMSEIAIDHGDVEQARASLDQLPRSEITDGLRLRVRSVVAMSEHRWEDAVELLNAAREMLAQSPEQLLKVDLNLADCLEQLARMDDQLVVYRRILKYAPQSINARTGLASTLARSGRYPEALAEYRQLVHLPHVRLQMAAHLIDYNRQLPEVARDWKEVSTLLDAATAEGNSTVPVAVLKAEVLMAQQDFEEARRVVIEAMHSHPDNGDLLAIQIRIAESSGDTVAASQLRKRTQVDSDQAEESERQLQMTLLEASDNGAAAVAVMQFYLQHGQADQALAVFEKHASAMSRIELSRAYEVFGDLHRAVDTLQREVQEHPDNLAALQTLAELLVRHERSDLAEPILERLVSASSNVSSENVRSARRSLAVLLARKQKYRAFQRAVSLMDQNAAETPAIATADLRTMATVLQLSPKQSDRQVAIGLLEKIDDRRQMSPEDRWQLAKLYTFVGQRKLASPQFDRAAKSGLASPEFLADFVTHLIESDELRRAWEQLERLPMNCPQPDRVRLNVKYLVALGQADAAIAELDGFIEAGSIPASQVDRSLLAATTCREILASEYSNNTSSLGHAVDRYLQDAVVADPKQVRHLIPWLVQRDRDVEAFDLLDTVWRELPAGTAANLSLDMLRSGSNRNRRERVEQYLVTHSQAQPESLELKLCLADVKSLAENYAEAEELYREIIRTDNLHVPALNSLAWMLAMRGRLLDEAMTFVERAMAEAGPVSRLLDTRGCVKLAQSRLRAANDDLIAAVDAGSTPETLLHLAFVQAESGDVALAQQTLAHAVGIGLRAETLHPLDRRLFDRLQSQILGGQEPSERSSVDL